MRLSNSGAQRINDPYGEMMVIFNATNTTQTVKVDDLKDFPFALHPLQAAANDAAVKQAKFAAGAFTVPALTTAVFVVKAEDVPQAKPTVAPASTSAPQPTSIPPITVPAQAPTAAPAATSAVMEPPASPVVPIVAVGAIVLVVAVVGFFLYRRNK